MLSGNRNFEGRIHPQVRANYLASPPLVVAYALAGTVDIDLATEPLGERPDGEPVYLDDIWPTAGGGRARPSRDAVDPALFRESTPTSSTATSAGSALPCPTGDTVRVGRRVDLRPGAALLQRPDAASRAPVDRHHRRARAGHARRLGHDRPHLARRLDPAKDARPGKYLIEHGVEPRDFNTTAPAAATTR